MTVDNDRVWNCHCQLWDWTSSVVKKVGCSVLPTTLTVTPLRWQNLLREEEPDSLGYPMVITIRVRFAYDWLYEIWSKNWSPSATRRWKTILQLFVLTKYWCVTDGWMDTPITASMLVYSCWCTQESRQNIKTKGFHVFRSMFICYSKVV